LVKKIQKIKNNHETITFVPTKKKISILKTYWFFVVSVKKTNKNQHPNLHDTFEVKTHNNNSVYIHSSVLCLSP